MNLLVLCFTNTNTIVSVFIYTTQLWGMREYSSYLREYSSYLREYSSYLREYSPFELREYSLREYATQSYIAACVY